MSVTSFRNVAMAVAWRGFRQSVGSPAFFVSMLMFPLFLFGALIGGLSQVRDIPRFDFAGDYASFQFVFVLLQSAAAGGALTGIAIAIDFQTGFARRLLLASPNRGGIVAGAVLVAIQQAVAIWVVLVAVGLIGGMRVGGSGVDMFGLFGLALLVNVAATLWAAGIAMRIRSLQASPVMQMPVLMVFFLAPVFVPIGLLTGWIHAVAQINPVTALLNAGRGLISGQPEVVALAFGIAVALVVLMALWARGGLRSAETAS
ncbi:MAG: ABC transporter permease [Actinomycetota bacterium]